MPEQVPVRDGLFATDAHGDDHLIGGRCGECGRHHFPFTGTCPYCGASDIREVALSQRGTLWGWTAVTTAPPGYRGEVPFGFGVVALPEGLRVITRIDETDPDRLEFGMPMRLAITPLHVDDEERTVMSWTFTPAVSG
jgi:uncharacterized protein